jgi:hypothetical protein
MYFLVPNIAITEDIVDDLILMNIEEENIHIIAKDSMPLKDLPEASLLQKSDFLPAIRKGAATGGAVGLLAGLVAVTLPVTGLVLGGGAVLAATLAGTGFGAWTASMIGISEPNSELDRFQQALDEGQVLMLIDVEEEQTGELERLVRKYHPQAEFKALEHATLPVS